ncbi:MAG: MarR family transcriptional regulator [Alphaproteobacteria bacterium]|nr:MarR family transcriptional regulator [Alphaproteobacteria bacterium]
MSAPHEAPLALEEALALLPPGMVPGSYPLESSAGHLLRRAVQRHQVLFQDHATGLGLTAPQFAALTRLAELRRATQNRLGRSVAMDPATIQGVMKRLMLRGLVRTEKDPLDRRTLVLVITPEGDGAVRTARAAGIAANGALMRDLNETERAQLLALLRRLTG